MKFVETTSVLTPRKAELLTLSGMTDSARQLMRHGFIPVSEFSGDKGTGTTVQLCERVGQRVVCKLLTAGSQEAMGRDVLLREREVLQARLPQVPEFVCDLLASDGSLEGLCRTFHPGASVTALVAAGNLSHGDFERSLRLLLRKFEARGFYLQDTDVSNFIAAAEDGIVNPHAIHRTLMLVDPEALAPKHKAILTGSLEETVQEVLRSLDAQVAKARKSA